MGNRLALAPIALLFLGSFTARCDDASKNAKIEQLFNLSKVDKTVQSGIDQTMDQMKGVLQQIYGTSLPPDQVKNVEELQGRIGKILVDTLSWEKLKPVYIKIYADAYTERQIDDLVAFFKTPTGQAMVDKGPALAEKGGQAAQQRLSAVMPAIQKLMKDFAPSTSK